METQRSSDIYSNDNLPPTFKFPIRAMQLCEQPADPNVFWVQDRINVGQWSERRLQEEVETAMEKLSGANRCLNIMNNDVFDLMYSVVFHLEDVNVCIKKEVVQTLVSGLKNLTGFIERTGLLKWASSNLITSQTMHQMIREDPTLKTALQVKNCLSAYVYLITWFLSDFSKLKESKEGNMTKGRRRVAKKDRTEDQEKQEIELNAISITTQEALKLLLEGVLQSEMHLLWPEQRIEEDFVKCFLKTGFDMLEHNKNNTRVQDCKQVIFDILQTCMAKYGSEIKYMQSQNNQKIIDLLYNQDNLAKPMAEFVGMVVERQGAQIANEIIRDLTKQIFHTDSSHETIGIKNIAKFLQKLSKIAPKAIYGNISYLLGFFDCEAYLLRQSLIKILANTIQYVLKVEEISIDSESGASIEQQQKTQQIYQQTKQKFLELLLKRFQDKSAFCRIKVMKVFTRLTEENLVPRFLYMDLFTAVIGRLKDVAVQVRKTALRLYQQMVCIYGLIFSVDVRTGAKFLSMEEVLRQFQSAEKDYNEAKSVFENQQAQLNQYRQSLMVQHPNFDTAQLQLIVTQNPRFVEMDGTLKKQQSLVENTEFIKGTFFEYGKFLTKMDDAGELLIQMLSSKTIQDTVEVIRVFKFLHHYGLPYTENGIRKMLPLVFSKEHAVVAAVVDCYQSLYFSDVTKVAEKVKNLLKLMKDATLTDVTCIEELLNKLIANDVFEREVFNNLWVTYLQFGRNFNSLSAQMSLEERRQLIQNCKHEQRASIQLLRMIGSSRVEVLLNHKDKLYESSLKFAKFDSPDFIIMKEAVLAYEKIVIYQIEKMGSASAGVLEVDKKHLFQLVGVIGKTFGTKDGEWYCAAESVLNVLFNIKSRNSHEYSKLFIDQIVRKMFRQRSEEEVEEIRKRAPEELEQIEPMPLKPNLTDTHFSQLFFVIGHVAIKMLTYVEQMESDVKQALADSFKRKKQDDGDADGRSSGEDGKNQEDDLAQITGGKEAEVEQYVSELHEITEKQLIQEGLLGRFTPLIKGVVNEALLRYTTPESALKAPQLVMIERSAILALSKFMCVSPRICAENLDLLFKLLHSNIEFGVKMNIIITVADLVNRFPNQLNERNKEIFMLLHDSKVHVRQQALMVITHLILNDMLKLQGEIVDICMLLEDEDERIKDQVKLFLHELHSKGNHIIYNLFPKAISRLSKEFDHLQKEEFENIARNLLKYINKDTQTMTLLERLCQKMKNSKSEIEWRNTAYCISQLKMTDKIFMKLLELYDCYKERLLNSPDVKEYFIQLSQACKRLMKPEMKQYLEDFELKVNLDEGAMLELKQNNPFLNAQAELDKIKRSKRRQQRRGESQMPSHIPGGDQEMAEPGTPQGTPSRKRHRDQMISNQVDSASAQQLALKEQMSQSYMNHLASAQNDPRGLAQKMMNQSQRQSQQVSINLDDDDDDEAEINAAQAQQQAAGQGDKIMLEDSEEEY